MVVGSEKLTSVAAVVIIGTSSTLIITSGVMVTVLAMIVPSDIDMTTSTYSVALSAIQVFVSSSFTSILTLCTVS